MNKLSKYLLIFLMGMGLVVLSGFMDGMNHEMPVEDKMMYSCEAQVSKFIKNKYHLSPSAVGGGVDKEGIWLMSLDFQRYGSLLTEEEARKLIVSCLDDFLELVNANEELRPYLKNFPFKPENIEIAIFSYTATREDTFHPYLRVVSADQGQISYYTKEPSDQFHYKSEKYESYDEAVAILKNAGSA